MTKSTVFLYVLRCCGVNSLHIWITMTESTVFLYVLRCCGVNSLHIWITMTESTVFLYVLRCCGAQYLCVDYYEGGLIGWYGMWCLTPLSTIFQFYCVGFIGGGNRYIRRKPQTCRKPLTHFIT